MNTETPPPRSPYQAQCLADSLRATLTTFKPQELAAKLGISREAVRSAIKSGELKAKRINSRVFIIESIHAADWWVRL
jgi:hypothetical protein